MIGLGDNTVGSWSQNVWCTTPVGMMTEGCRYLYDTDAPKPGDSDYMGNPDNYKPLPLVTGTGTMVLVGLGLILILAIKK